MDLITVVSILIRVSALTWALCAIRRGRAWPMIFLAAMLALMATRQTLTVAAGLRAQAEWSLSWGGGLTELPGLAVSVMAFAAVFMINAAMRRSERVTDALRESEERLKLALDGTELGVWDWDLRTGVVYVNERWASMLGYTKEEIEPLLQEWKLLHPDDRPAVMHALEEHFQGLTPMYETEHRLRTKSGEWKWVLDKGKVVERDAWGHALRATGTHHDIDALKCSEIALRDSEERFRQLTDHMHEVFWLTDHDTGEFLYCSPAFEKIFDRPVESAYADAESWRETIHPDDRARMDHALSNQFKEGPYDEEFRVVRSDGSIHWIHEQAFPVRDESGRTYRVAGVSEDVTARKNVEEELRQRHHIERLLFAELDHRVRNNLSSLITLIDMTRRQTCDAGEFADTVRARVLAMATVHGLLTSSRRLTTNLHDLVRALLPAEKGGKVDFAGERVEVDAGQATALAMVLHELIMNSTKYGALAADEGRIGLSWDVERNGGDASQVDLRWRETGGPLVEVKPTPGVGTALIEGLVRSDLRGDVTLAYEPGGVDHHFRLAIESRDRQ